MFDLLETQGKTEEILEAPFTYYHIDKEFYSYLQSHENQFSTILSDAFVQNNKYDTICDGVYNFQILRYQDTGGEEPSGHEITAFEESIQIQEAPAAGEYTISFENEIMSVVNLGSFPFKTVVMININGYLESAGIATFDYNIYI